MIVSEYHPGSLTAVQSPCAGIRLPVSNIISQLQLYINQKMDVQLWHDSAHDMLWLTGKPGSPVDEFIRTVDRMVAEFNALHKTGTPIELTETRLVTAHSSVGQDYICLTPGIRVVFGDHDPAEGRDGLTIQLNPGHAFGSGMHPSTRVAAMALENVVAHHAGMCPETVLDVGCGSGVLALVCARLGARQVLGIDISDDALAIARMNIARNQLGSRVKVANTPIEQVKGPFALLMANLTPSVQRSLAAHYLRLLNKDGDLLLAGFQERQAEDMLDMLHALGFALHKKYQVDGWQGMWFRKIA